MERKEGRKGKTQNGNIYFFFFFYFAVDTYLLLKYCELRTDLKHGGNFN